ncbi:MAG TPA: COX15/CtaA family protein [Solirubrobacteraceae bacterium]|jgi:cytochrome c oxidase assembly protein subunit 15|nr:COX15/CtaA family protein [Solirubrobacteraceae bacterium]
MRDRLAVTPRQFRLLAYGTLVALTLIVMSGAAVRLTDSGLGCENWPKCGGTPLPPLSTHALIEFGNRVVGFVVGLITVATAVFAFTRRPFRRDLAWLAVLLPLGVVAQAVLGGLTVLNHLAPGFVMAHFSLSLIILIAAFALAWRSVHEPGSRPRATDRVSVWSVRALAPLGALTIFAGTVASAAGPHGGGFTGQVVHRLHFKGADTLTWAIHQHAAIGALFGVCVIGVWFLRRRRGATGDALEPLTVLGVLLAAQGLVGSVQYELHLPSDMVWVHVTLATVSWIAVLWAWATEGSLARRAVAVDEAETAEPARARSRKLEAV